MTPCLNLSIPRPSLFYDSNLVLFLLREFRLSSKLYVHGLMKPHLTQSQCLNLLISVC